MDLCMMGSNLYLMIASRHLIRAAELKGFAMWETGGDSNDTLLDSIVNATQNGGPTSAPSPGSFQA
ncbi:hypothetical protein BDN70DRAFT_938179 [Pholiota conissans]|uniref:Uncharacterized protein n=1 Tax=Pholiota conissans TaxID=109636 RepID=A0A9P6CTT7_9AGAR|nr:hypothetical protein BDN70DRAFT_938179 [Pholiota conissans]